MNLTLKINGIDRTSSVVWNSLEKSDVLNEKVDTLRFAVRKYGSSSFVPAVDDEVELLDGSDTIYKGIILTARKSTEGHSVVRYDIDCVDNTHYLSGPLVLERYKDKTIDFIIDDIITKYDPDAVLDGLVAHYKLNGDATDSSGAENDGTANSVTYVAGKIRQAGSFDGANSYINVPDSADLMPTAFTISVWVNPTDYLSQYTRVLEKGGYLNGGGYGLEFNDSGSHKMHLTIWDNLTAVVLATTSDIPTGALTHIVATFDGATAKVYVNGGYEAKVSAVMTSNTFPLKIGGRGVAQDNFKGIIDDLRIYNQVLTPDEITKIYNIGFTTNNVDAPVEVKSITFNRISVAASLQKLATLSNYSWYLDYDNDIHFFEKNTEPAPFSITDTSGNYIYDSLEVTDDISQLRNRVYVQGGEAEGDERTEEYDGGKKFYKLSNKFARLPSVSVDGVAKSVGVDFLDEEDDFDCFWNYNETYIRFKTDTASGTKNVDITGVPLYSVSAQVQDPDSIDQYGLYEFSKVDKTIKSKEEAKHFAVSELEAYAQKISEGGFETYTAGLRSGQLITINSASRDINEDFLIQKVTFRMVNKDVGIYSVELATLKTITIIDFLLDQLRLGTRIIEEQDNEILEKFIDALETITIGESFSSSTSHNPQSETITIGESFTAQSLNYAVEAVLGPQVPSGTKRQFVLDGSTLA